ncbi:MULTISPECIES: hypothetical protein [unclassified Mesorhizobium]|uniref:hypothetical protein n=1 Tax=unclassified Mesorhizobium TaxID=325217 RepID=UPI000FCBC92F|nr:MULTISPECIES: hypothetical protein [unclassified Mesorhizobium]RUW74397.1 hypothetical protein EOA31_11265 [Mesorhizobium sp. M4B.F.Ca.ET.049.02.1.2]TGV27593.1 hypothetical protein EN786_05400 [Mesorhizobium sp. M4B.F.Ca.ET.143.01.1.1]
MDEAAKNLRALRFVADMTRKLAKMLSRTRYHMLVYFLEMTAVEAETLADAQDPKLTLAQKAPEPKN